MSIYTFSEAELRSRFIKNIGNRDDIDVYIEVPVFCRSVDLVIQEKENAEIFAIEFKLRESIYMVIHMLKWIKFVILLCACLSIIFLKASLNTILRIKIIKHSLVISKSTEQLNHRQ